MLMKNKKEQYLIDKYMGGRANMPRAKNIEVELEDGYEFGEVKAFGKTGFGIKKKKDGRK